jgi:hypothetical protein
VIASNRARAALFCVLAGAVAAGVLPAQTYKNAREGFAFSPPDKWTLVPVAPDEKQTAAKWVSKNPIRDITAELVVMVFDKVPKKKVADAGADSKPSYAEDPFALTSYEKLCKLPGARQKFELSKPREVKVKGTTTKARVFDEIFPRMWTRGPESIGAWFGVALIDTPERQFALEMMAVEAAKDKLAPLFLEAVRSFKVLDASEVQAEEDEAALAGMSEKEKARRTAELTKRQVPGWWFKESANYVVLTNIKPDRGEMIDVIKTRLEQMRKIYLQDFPPIKPVEAVSIVRVCATRKDYINYGGSPSSAGYWNPAAEELVLYTGVPKDETLAVLNHEAFHQYIHYCFGELAPHSWYNEGHGDYYSGAEPEGSGLKIKPFRWRTDTIKTAIASKKYVPIEKIITYSQGEYYANATLCYAEGWSIVWFLKKGLPKNHPWQKILPTYFETVRETKDPARAVKIAFEGVDFAAFEQAWGAFITKEIPAPMIR